MRGDGVEAHQERALLKSLEYSSWPFVEYLHALKGKFDRYPKYAVAMSSDGPDRLLEKLREKNAAAVAAPAAG